MARKPDVALLITASGSFDNEHKLEHIKKHLRPQDFKTDGLFLAFTTFLRRKLKNQRQIQGEDFYFF